MVSGRVVSVKPHRRIVRIVLVCLTPEILIPITTVGAIVNVPRVVAQREIPLAVEAPVVTTRLTRDVRTPFDLLGRHLTVRTMLNTLSGKLSPFLFTDPVANRTHLRLSVMQGHVLTTNATHT